jgi:tetratricopeptide (TPR) repeat protein
MYIPSIGLFLLIVWGLASVAGHSRMEQATTADGRSPAQFSVPHGAFAVTGSLALILCLLLTRAQLAYWHDSASLFRHAAEVTTDNSIAYDHLGKALMDQGDLEESAKWFGQALALTPDDAEAHYKVATVRLLQGRLDEAIAEFSAALRRHPDYAEAHRNIGVALMRQGKLREGITHFSEVLRINPSPDAHFNLGVAHLQLNEPKEAAGCFVESLRLEPNAPKTQYHLALALAAQKDRSQEAIAAAEKARDLARAAGQPELAAKAQALLNQPPPENPKSE